MSYKLNIQSDMTVPELAMILLTAITIQDNRIGALPLSAKRHFVEGADWTQKNNRYVAEIGTQRLVVRANENGKWLWFIYSNTDDALVTKSVAPHHLDSMSAMAAVEAAAA